VGAPRSLKLVSPARAVALMTFSLACTGLMACGGSSNTASSIASAPPPSTTVTRLLGATPPASAPIPQASTGKPGKAPTPNTVKPPSGARPPAATQPRLREAFAQFTSCMRQNGVDIPEPGAKRSSPRKPLDTAGPRFKAALAKCRNTVTAALRANPAGAG
jgi:hypothetical protein